MTSKKIGITILGLCWFFYLGFHLNQSNTPLDFFLFRIVGRSVPALSLDNVYSRDGRKRLAKELDTPSLNVSSSHRYSQAAYVWTVRYRDVQPTATPFLYSLFYLVSTDNFDFDYRLFWWVSLFFYVGAITYFCVAFNVGFIGSALILYLFASVFGPFFLGGFALRQP